MATHPTHPTHLSRPPGPPLSSAQPAHRPHVVDATMFWPALPTGGVRTVLLAKRQQLWAHGWHHSLVVPLPSRPFVPDLVDSGGIRIPRSGGYRFVTRLGGNSRRMAALAPDLIEAGDPYVLAWSALRAARTLGVPAVAFCHSDPVSLACQRMGPLAQGRPGRALGAALRRYLVDLYARFDVVLAPSAFLADRLRAWGIAQVEQQALGVDCQVFTPDWRRPEFQRALRRGLGLTDRTRLLVYFGRFAPEKHLQLLADAVARLGPEHVLLLVGAGPSIPQGRQVRVLPPIRQPLELARTVACCDAFVHAGDQETFGLAALEAMACGVPVVLSSRAGLGELGADTALTLESPRAAPWAEAMACALGPADEGRLERALAKARAHDWRQVVPAMMRRYLRLMGEVPGRAPGTVSAAGTGMAEQRHQLALGPVEPPP